MRSAAMGILLAVAIAATGQDRPATSPATHPATAPGGSRFTYVDVVIDPQGRPLAAWQVEFAAEVGSVNLVGIEQGEHPAYAKRPPYYDAAALSGNRVILGDFSLDADLPKAPTRVARLMLEIRGPRHPQYVAKLMAAASPDGGRIPAAVTVEPAKDSREAAKE